MRASVIASVILACTLIARADDTPKPNTLTTKEIADGWISLFDGETTFGWKIEGDGKVENGALLIGGGNKDTRAATTSYFADFDVEYRYSGQKLDQLKVRLNGQEHAPPSISPLPLQTLKGKMEVRSTGANHTASFSSLSAGPPGLGLGTQAATTFPREFPGASCTSIEFIVPAGSELKIRSIRIKPTGLKPIFNGKDLTGWKPIEGKKSKFDVTPEGELSIIDGNGDIQTTDQWDDFLLQIEVKSNGDHLNSGVFFRCIPDQFWSGYEAQIRNEWKGDDRSQAVDYGTGGLYNRQPARKVVSSDREWFTMTVLAHGPHIAIWVNGYQTVDFTETKPLGNNARKGGKITAGPISLQGHDPTTNLLFKNIRIANLPKDTKPTPP